MLGHMLAHATLILEQRKIALFGPHEALSYQDFPRTVGAIEGAGAGAVGGAAHGMMTGSSGLGYLARLGLGAGMGGILGHTFGDIQGQTTADEELDNLKYDREGPARSALALARPFIPTFHSDPSHLPGQLAIPASHQGVDLASWRTNVTEPVDPGELAALGGRVSPQQVSVQLNSPHVAGDHLLRPQYINNQPVRVPTLDEFVKADNGKTITGSESPGSRVGYDYNGALSNFFSNRLPVQPGEHAVMIGSHAHGDPLGVVSGVHMGNALHSLQQQGIINKDTDSLGIMSCNAGGCDVPAATREALGFVPPKMLWTPPGAVSTQRIEDAMLGHLRANPDLAHRSLLHPHTLTMTSAEAVEPEAARYHTDPFVPTQATDWINSHRQGVTATTGALAHMLPGPVGPLASSAINHYAPTALDALHRGSQPQEYGYDNQARPVDLDELRAKHPMMFSHP